MSTPIPNRLTDVPKELYDRLDDVLSNDKNYDQYIQRKRLRSLVGLAYKQGYTDGYRDGHTDAENGHDERFMVSLA